MKEGAKIYEREGGRKIKEKVENEMDRCQVFGVQLNKYPPHILCSNSAKNNNTIIAIK